MKSELESKLHPHVPAETLRNEYRNYYGSYGLNYDEWLQFMHDQHKGKKTTVAVRHTPCFVHIMAVAGAGTAFLAALFCAICLIAL